MLGTTKRKKITHDSRVFTTMANLRCVTASFCERRDSYKSGSEITLAKLTEGHILICSTPCTARRRLPLTVTDTGVWW